MILSMTQAFVCALTSFFATPLYSLSLQHFQLALIDPTPCTLSKAESKYHFKQQSIPPLCLLFSSSGHLDGVSVGRITVVLSTGPF